MTYQNNSEHLGKPGMLSAPLDPQTLHLSNYIDFDLFQNVPSQIDWTTKKITPWGAMGNKNLADCTVAAAGHMIECWTSNVQNDCALNDQAVLTAFIALTGYDPVTGENDKAVHLSDTLKYWRKIGIGHHKINSYAIIDHTNKNVLKTALYIFGGLYAGINLPNSVHGKILWDVVPGELTGDNAPGSLGGHVVALLAYDEEYLTFISWGKVKKMTWNFLKTYGESIYAIIAEDFIKGNKTPLGFNLNTLQLDLEKIANLKNKTTMEAGRGGTKGGGSEMEAGSAGGAVA